MKELKKGIIEAVQDSIDLTDNQVSISTLNIMLDEILPEQLRLYFVSQQRELFDAILDFSEDLPMCTEDYHRSELWEKYKALNCG
tara:strand:+ start:91 stop:345 length:255 start_codon:yes stop_codon:yes gene_type:complete